MNAALVEKTKEFLSSKDGETISGANFGNEWSKHYDSRFVLPYGTKLSVFLQSFVDEGFCVLHYKKPKGECPLLFIECKNPLKDFGEQAKNSKEEIKAKIAELEHEMAVSKSSEAFAQMLLSKMVLEEKSDSAKKAADAAVVAKKTAEKKAVGAAVAAIQVEQDDQVLKPNKKNDLWGDFSVDEDEKEEATIAKLEADIAALEFSKAETQKSIAEMEKTIAETDLKKKENVLEIAKKAVEEAKAKQAEQATK